MGFLAVSDSPITLDKDRWRAALTNYRIDGTPILDLTIPAQRARLESVLKLADGLDTANGEIESRGSLLARLKNVRLITDDNMGTEWLQPAEH